MWFCKCFRQWLVHYSNYVLHIHCLKYIWYTWHFGTWLYHRLQVIILTDCSIFTCNGDGSDGSHDFGNTRLVRYTSRLEITCFKVTAKSYNIATRTSEPGRVLTAGSELAAYQSQQRCAVELEPRGTGGGEVLPWPWSMQFGDGCCSTERSFCFESPFCSPWARREQSKTREKNHLGPLRCSDITV
jgi:hypothetical protein